MSKRPVFFVMVCLVVSAACALSPSAGSTGQSTSAPQAAGTPVQPAANSPATSLPLPLTPTSSTGRSAGIDLSGPSGTAAPNIPPTLAPQSKLVLVPDEWYPLNAGDEGGDISMTVLGWGVPAAALASEWSGDQKVLHADAGYKYLRVEVVIANHGSAYEDMFPAAKVKLKDGAGNTYQPNNLFFRYEDDFPGDNLIAPGEHLRHNFYFTVPDNDTLLNFWYDPCGGGSLSCTAEAVEIPLEKAAASAQAPAEVTTSDADMRHLGELITLEKLAISVIRWHVESPTDPSLAERRPPGVNVVGVSILVANLDSETISSGAASGMSVSLKDNTGWFFPSDPYSGAWGGQLEPGEWQQEYYAFQTPPGVEGLELVIDTGEPAKWPQITRTFVSLGAQPALDLSPIEQMPGSIAPNPVPLGQAGMVGPFQLSVQKAAFPNTSACGDIPAGYKAILVTANGLNTSSVKEETYAVQAYLKDSHGNLFSACNTENDSIATSGLDAGGTMNLVYSFLVPDFGGEVYLVEQAPDVGSPKIFFALK